MQSTLSKIRKIVYITHVNWRLKHSFDPGFGFADSGMIGEIALAGSTG